MFKKIFDAMETNFTITILLCTAAWACFPFAGAILIATGADYDNSKSISLGTTFIVCSAIPFILLALDSIAGRVIRYITDKDFHKRRPIGEIIFGESWDCWVTDFSDRYATLYSVTSLPLLVIVITTLFPKLWVVVGPVIGLIGILWLLLWGLKKGYQVRKMLAEHVNNKSIHKE